MAAVFFLPRQTLLGAAGAIATTGSVRFFNATTTTPRTVYSDSGLTTPILQPIVADSAGRLPKIYIATGAYKVVYYSDAAGTAVVYTEDNCDTGIPAGSGALAVANGGTAATTAAAARTNLGAASQTDQDALASSVAALEAELTGVGGSLGALAGLDTITRTQLASGFGAVCLKRSLVDSETALVTVTGTIPHDNTIPQISEGGEVLSGSYTPVSASSELEIEISMDVGTASGASLCAALFQNTDLSAISARWIGQATATSEVSFHFKHRMASPGTSPITFSVRIGGQTGNSYLNASTTTRIGGGSQFSSIHISEWLTV